ncbi:MAG TPA: hypothetical protein DEA40_13180 [Parvularcula sp.]|nr:hypothetical protein [Parvularcula sp.]
MPSSLRTPSGIAIRAVAAASLFASRPKSEAIRNDEVKAGGALDAKAIKFRAGLKSKAPED